MREIQKIIIDRVLQSKRVAIFIHKDPDGDCIGASSAMKIALEDTGKSVDIFSPNKVPDVFSFLPTFNSIKTDKVDVNNYDLMISLDSSEPNRIGSYEKTFMSFENTVVLDHHENNTYVGEAVFVDKTCAAACEIVYHLLKKINPKFLTKNVADCLFLGLMTDTGNFMYSNTTIEALEIMMETVKAGADRYDLIHRMFGTRSEKSFEALQYMYANMKRMPSGVAYCEFPYSMIKKRGFQKYDVSGFANIMIECEGVKIGVFAFGASNTEYDISIRSQVGYNALSVAKKFGGGGHVCASGCKIKNSKVVRQQIIDIATQEVERCENRG